MSASLPLTGRAWAGIAALALAGAMPGVASSSEIPGSGPGAPAIREERFGGTITLPPIPEELLALALNYRDCMTGRIKGKQLVGAAEDIFENSIAACRDMRSMAEDTARTISRIEDWPRKGTPEREAAIIALFDALDESQRQIGREIRAQMASVTLGAPSSQDHNAANH